MCAVENSELNLPLVQAWWKRLDRRAWAFGVTVGGVLPFFVQRLLDLGRFRPQYQYFPLVHNPYQDEGATKGTAIILSGTLVDEIVELFLTGNE